MTGYDQNPSALKRTLNNPAYRNYLVEITALLPFIGLLFSGVVMLVYHSGTATTYRIIWLNGEQWLTLHHLLTICALPFVTLHIILHWRIVLKLISPAKKHRHKPLNLILLVTFISTAISGLIAWLILKEQNLAGLFHDVHNKLGMALIVFYSLHFSLYSPVLLRMSGLNARKKGSQNP